MPTDLPTERAVRKPGTLELDPAAEGARELVRDREPEARASPVP